MINYIAGRIFYIVFGLLLSSLSIFSLFLKRKKIVSICFASLLIVFVIFASIRADSVGLDTVAYSNTYAACRNIKQAKNIILKNKPEYLFYGLVTFFSAILKTNEVVFRLFYYLLIAICLYLSFYKIENGLFMFTLMMFLGFFNMSFSGIRQAMSMSIMTMATSWLLFERWKTKTKLIIYYALNIVAVGFHSSSLLMMIIPLLLMLPVKKDNFIYMFPLLIFMPLIIKRGIYFVSFYTYVAYGFEQYRVSITFILTLLLIVIYHFMNVLKAKNVSFISDNKYVEFSYSDIDSKMLILVFVSLSFMACNTFSLVLPRYSMYFYLEVAYFLTHFFRCFKKTKLHNIAYISIVSAFFLYFVYTVSSLGLVPYSIQ